MHIWLTNYGMPLDKFRKEILPQIQHTKRPVDIGQENIHIINLFFMSIYVHSEQIKCKNSTTSQFHSKQFWSCYRNNRNLRQLRLSLFTHLHCLHCYWTAASTFHGTTLTASMLGSSKSEPVLEALSTSVLVSTGRQVAGFQQTAPRNNTSPKLYYHSVHTRFCTK